MRSQAVQLAYSNPRCRVLVFHTGRLVGTGTGGAAAALCCAATQATAFESFILVWSEGCIEGTPCYWSCSAFPTTFSRVGG